MLLYLLFDLFKIQNYVYNYKDSKQTLKMEWKINENIFKAMEVK